MTDFYNILRCSKHFYIWQWISWQVLEMSKVFEIVCSWCIVASLIPEGQNICVLGNTMTWKSLKSSSARRVEEEDICANEHVVRFAWIIIQYPPLCVECIAYFWHLLRSCTCRFKCFHTRALEVVYKVHNSCQKSSTLNWLVLSSVFIAQLCSVSLTGGNDLS
jgi:hypothetical protein